MRSTQCHRGVPEVNPKFFTLLEILYEWTTPIYYTGSLNIYRSIVQGELLAGTTSDQRCTHWTLHCPKQAMSPQAYPRWCLTSVQTDQVLMQSTCWTLRLFQADSFAIILYNTMPREALVKAVKVNRNDSEPENLLYKRPPQLTEVTRTNCSMRTEQGSIQGEPKVARQRGPGKDFTDEVIDETGS